MCGSLPSCSRRARDQARLADAGLARRAAPPGPRRPWPAPSARAAGRAPGRARRAASALPAQRLEAALGLPLAEHPPAATGSAKPLRRAAPRSASSNRPPSRRRVPVAITMVPGAASACRRAARLGVSPTTASSAAAPAPISSPTTTSARGDADPRRERRRRRAPRARDAATTASPARTARSASSSWARGQPK